MIKKLEEFGTYVLIAGFRKVEIKNVDGFFSIIREKLKNEDVIAQFFNAQFVAGWQHLYFATLNALTSFKNRENISNSLAVEILLYASAQRQIKRAVEKLGIKPETHELAIVLVSKSENVLQKALEAITKLSFGEREDNVLALSDQKVEKIKKLFSISDLELKAKMEKEGLEKEALIDLVIEHMALLTAER
ncbi:MAG: KEOPS complex subunit Cgi121 [Candidatus Bathyarchaeia archaeon]